MEKYTLAEYCAAYNRLELMREWNNEKNGELLPDTVSFGTHRKVWWKCKEGHEWQAEVKARTAGNGCPYCSGRMILAGYNDLAALYPLLAAEWHPVKNGELKPQDVRPGTKKKVWWQCKEGHEWQSVVASRTNGCGCPVCSGKAVAAGENDLASLRPALAAEWHPEKNGVLRPDMVTVHSNRVVWWQDKFGHEWQARIASRANGNGCPICSNKKLLPGYNDLKTRFPEIAAEWDSEKNGITPDKVMAANKKVWWRCPKGHEYRCQISVRVYNNEGCPVCAGRVVVKGVNDLETCNPRLAAEWHPTRNGSLTPAMLVSGSNKPVWWQDEFGHEWRAPVSDRSFKGTGCPYCTGKKVLPGFNDLLSQEPEIAKQWHPVLNGSKKPDMYTCCSNQRIWWQCADGHIWEAPIARRYRERSGCPVCSGRVSKKKLIKYERIMRELHAE